ncbi:hypothetical protein EV122DRAFT_293667 [Schizophyllum commune]
MHRALYLPSPEEADGIQERLERLDAATDEMRRLLACLEHQAALGRALLSPWRRLPLELWQQILYLALPRIWDGKHVDFWRQPIAAVCRAWRDIVHSLPFAGARIGFEVDSEELPESGVLGLDVLIKSDLEQMIEWPLHVCIVDDTDDDMSSPLSYFFSDEAPVVWASICEQSHRWVTAELQNVPDDLLVTLRHRPLPLLRSLLLAHYGDINITMSTDEILCRLDAFTTAASLSSVHIHGFWAPYSLTLPSSWTRITSLSVEYSDRWDEEAAPFSAVLACSQTLRSCAIKGCDYDADWIPRTLPLPEAERVLCPVLEELDLQECGILVMCYISTPGLRAVTLNEGYFGEHARQKSSASVTTLGLLQELLHTSHGCPSLLSLKLKDTCIKAILDVLRCLPRLASLHIEDRRITSIGDDIVNLAHALERRRERPDSVALLPNLSRLHIRLDVGISLDSDFADLVRKLVWSRSPDNPCTLDGQRLAYLEDVFT